MKVILNGSLSCHPFYGQRDDVIDLPEEIAEAQIGCGNAELLSDRLAKNELVKKGISLQAEPKAAEAEVAPAVTPEESAKVEEIVAGMDELFEKQHGETAEEAPGESPAEPTEEKKSKKK